MLSTPQYLTFADAIKATENKKDAQRLAGVCVGIFRNDNPRFDAKIEPYFTSVEFYKACGLDKDGVRPGGAL